MTKVKYILSPTEIPAGQNYVLVTYGEEYGQTRHPLGLTITVARQKSKTISELSFLTAIHTAKFRDFRLQIVARIKMRCRWQPIPLRGSTTPCLFPYSP
jgi:hypothetical protein